MFSIEKMPPVKDENLIHLQRYVKFINSRPERDLKKDGFHTHHIYPKSIAKKNNIEDFDGDWNLIELTPREHFIAHLILWKCGYREMISAFFFMNGNKRYGGSISSRLFEKLALQFAEETSIRFTGKPLTEDHKSKISDSHTGMVTPLETCEKIRKIRLGSKDSEETKLKKSISHTGEKNFMYGKNWRDFASKEKIEEVRAKQSANSLGEKNHMYGRSSLEFKTDEEILEIKLKKQKTWNSKEDKTRSFKGKYKIITNELENKSILKDEQVPDGWRLGRKHRTKEANAKNSEYRKGSISITNGIENKVLPKNQDQTIPQGWWRGQTKWKTAHT